jgi:Family of unknown function (DUF5681)
MSKPDGTGQKQDTRFKPGRSGNPKGRPPGTRNVATLAMEALLDGEAEALMRRAIELAKSGDVPALRICLDRILPPRKDRPVWFKLPKIESDKDVVHAISTVLASVAAGEITPADASEVTKLLDAYVKAFEAVALAERVERLEKVATGGRQ